MKNKLLPVCGFLAVLLALTFIACNTENNDDFHEHDFKWKTTLAPTCTKQGARIETCIWCGQTRGQSETLPMSDHNFVNGACTVCHKPCDHNFWNGQCTVCGIMQCADGHTYGPDADCVNPQICTVCGLELKPATGHDYRSYVSNEDATCLQDGTKTAVCENGCGSTDTLPDQGSIKDHTIAEATCTTPRQCTVCYTIFSAPTGHDYRNYVSNGDATCTQDGTKTAVCENGCGITDTLPDDETATGHDYRNYVPYEDATCTQDATTKADCENGCGIPNILPVVGTATGHVFEYTEPVSPTCTEEGYVLYTCYKCLETERRNISPPEHTPNTETGICIICAALTYNVNDFGPGGGKIFYRSDSGFTFYTSATDRNGVTAHYLEAAPDNMPTSLLFGHSNPTQTTGTAIGTGKRNTAIIIASERTTVYAARACDSYAINGKTDWFLPSRDELNELYKYKMRYTPNNLGISRYWSSSLYTSQSDTLNIYVWCQEFQSGTYGSPLPKQSDLYEYYVRAVRAF